jgi:hypothetical protein
MSPPNPLPRRCEIVSVADPMNRASGKMATQHKMNVAVPDHAKCEITASVNESSNGRRNSG